MRMRHDTRHPSASPFRSFLACPAALLCGVLLCGNAAFAQQQASAIGRTLMQDAAVTQALDAVRRNEPAIIEEQIAICQIPAPPFKEAVRAAAYKKRFQELGLKNVRIDKEGNVLGERPGRAARPHLVFSAHLDTVFPEGTDVTVKRNGTVLAGPGISDDCRGLAVVIGVIRALNEAKIETPGTITFVGTVGEEGLGDLRGVKHLFNVELKDKVDRFVSVDGTGPPDVLHQAVGSRRYRVTFSGPGGHSYGAFGLANPSHALGRAIAQIADVRVPETPKTTFNVGRVGGGTSVNSIATDAWMEIDMRSVDANALKTLEGEVLSAIDRALADENARWNNRGKLTVEKKLVGDRPAGTVPRDAPISQAAGSTAQALGLPVTFTDGSQDPNYPISLGIPSIGISGGGQGNHAHSPDESFDTTDSWKGTQWALLVCLALAQP